MTFKSNNNSNIIIIIINTLIKNLAKGYFNYA